MSLNWDVRRLVSMKRAMMAFRNGVLKAAIAKTRRISWVTGDMVKIVEKPVTPPSNYAVTGLYVFDKTATEKEKKSDKIASW